MTGRATDDQPIRLPGGGAVHINPGTGSVIGADERHAIDNIEHFITDLKLDHVRWLREPREDERGRFTFLLYLAWAHPHRCTLIDMPGLPLDRVRYVGSDGQNPWDYPRLYVDGSSWLWGYAIGCARDALTGKEDDE